MNIWKNEPSTNRLTENFTRMIFPFAESEITPQVTPQVRALLEIIIAEHTREELQTALDLTDREHFRKSYLLPALEAGLIVTQFSFARHYFTVPFLLSLSACHNGMPLTVPGK